MPACFVDRCGVVWVCVGKASKCNGTGVVHLECSLAWRDEGRIPAFFADRFGDVWVCIGKLLKSCVEKLRGAVAASAEIFAEDQHLLLRTLLQQFTYFTNRRLEIGSSGRVSLNAWLSVQRWCCLAVAYLTFYCVLSVVFLIFQAMYEMYYCVLSVVF